MATDIAACGAYLAVGQLLRRSGLIQDSDTQVAHAVVRYATLPSLALLVLQRTPVDLATVARVIGSGAAGSLVVAAVSWLIFRRRKPRERAVLLGCTIGSTAQALPLAFSQAALGAIGLQCALLLSIVNSIAVYIGSYLALGSAGAAFPDKFVHTDGGSYRGEWDGMDKAGCGTYRYPSKARYEGEWQDNTKEGFGIYYYPKGGLYKGEWRDGAMEGLGVRVYKSGRLAAGRWARGALAEELPASACAAAVQAADRAAQAARRVKVGGGGLSDALQLLTTCVPFWAALAGVGLSVTHSALPATLAAVVPPLASAHLPLALLTAGAAADFTPLQAYQLRDVGLVLGARLLPPLLAGAAAALLAPPAWLPLVCVLVLLLTGPVADECCQYAHFFRLDERLARSLTHASVLSSVLVAAPLAYVAAGTSHPLAADATRQALSAGMLAGAAAVLAVAVALARVAAARRPVVKMVYRKSAEELQQQLQQPGSLGGGNTSRQQPPTTAACSVQTGTAQQPSVPQCGLRRGVRCLQQHTCLRRQAPCLLRQAALLPGVGRHCRMARSLVL